ncbi:protein Ltv1p [[Candida] anglica]
MSSRRRFNKKNAQTFSVVHRAHDDALFYDNEASEHVLVPVKGGNQAKKTAYTPTFERKKKVFTTEDIAEDVGKDVRENEGMAAQFGIYYDDSKYDYMQHLKPIGKTDGVFIEADSKKNNPAVAGKKKTAAIEDLFQGQLPSERKTKVTYDTFQNIPEDLKGFNPDMDPRLREVLEALEDEAYLERRVEGTDGGNEDADGQDPEDYADNDDDLFADLLGSGEVDEYDEEYYGEGAYEDEYDEWDLDNYEDEYAKYDRDEEYAEGYELPYNEGEAPEELVDNAGEAAGPGVSFWEKDFNKFKAENRNKENDWDSDNEFEDEDDFVGELPSTTAGTVVGGAASASAAASSKKKSKSKLRKKKGAMSDTSAFSMSSSALFRTEGLTLLDDRYEQLAKKFEDNDEEEEEEEYQEFDMLQERGDLEGMLDDFLDNYELEKGGRRLVKKDMEKKKLQEAADSVSKGKVAAKRKKEKELGGLGNSFGAMSLK